MHKIIIPIPPKVVLLLSVLLIPSFNISADEGDLESRVRVHVLPIVNRTESEIFDAAAQGVEDTVSLTLRLMGSYLISSGVPEGFEEKLPLPVKPVARNEILDEMTEEMAVENIVFGGITSTGKSGDEGGEAAGGTGSDKLPHIELYVYDRLSKTVVQSESRQPESLFGLFGTTDRITAALLSSFSGRRVAFGSLRLAPSGGKASYRVWVDGNKVGENIRSVDTLLIGKHIIRIEAGPEEISQEVYTGEVEIAEEETSRLEFGLPTAAEVSLESAKRRQTDAIEKIMAERKQLDVNNYEIEALEETLAIYYRADEYYGPEELRAAAKESGRLAAQYAERAAREDFGNRDFEKGAEAVRKLEKTALNFGVGDELFGYREEVDYVADRWTEYAVQKEKKPRPWLPVVFGGFGITLVAIGGTTGREGEGLPPDVMNKPSAVGAPFIPLMVASGALGVWNALDWDLGRNRRSLIAYGKKDLRRSAGWSPGSLEVSAGVGMGLASVEREYYFSSTAASAGADNFFLMNGLFTGIVELRSWFNSHNAVGVSFISSIPGIGPTPPQFTMRNDEGDPLAGTDLSQSYDFTLLGNWRYTRTGKAYIQLGVGYRWMAPHLKENDLTAPVYDAYVEELGSGNPRIEALLQELGLGFRFGRGFTRPWDFMIRYTMEEVFFEGKLSQANPFLRHGMGFQFSRALILVSRIGEGEKEGTSVSPESESAFAGKREKTEERWSPLPVSLYADMAGIIYGGSRYGMEFPLGASLFGSLYVRSGFNLEDLMYDETKDLPMTAAWPGISLRYFLPPLDRRLYVGLAAEYAPMNDYRLRGESSDNNDEGEYRNTEGTLFIAETEVGLRFSFGRSGFFDIGTMFGWAFGSYDLQWTDLDSNLNEVYTEADYSVGNQFWFNPVLSFGVKMY